MQGDFRIHRVKLDDFLVSLNQLCVIGTYFLNIAGYLRSQHDHVAANIGIICYFPLRQHPHVIHTHRRQWQQG